jgi:hypothetical protein
MFINQIKITIVNELLALYASSARALKIQNLSICLKMHVICICSFSLPTFMAYHSYTSYTCITLLPT